VHNSAILRYITTKIHPDFTLLVQGTGHHLMLLLLLLYDTDIIITIGVFTGVRGVAYRYPTFWTEGYSTPHFSGQKMKNLLSPAVNRGDLWILNYNKPFFGRTPLVAHDTPALSPHSRMRREYFLSILLPLISGPRSPSELVLPLFRPKLRP